MTYLKYQILLTVVETKSFTKASEKLGYTQSAVSQMINGLEKELGVKLLNRSRQGITTTKIGERILTHIKEIMRINDLMMEEAAYFKNQHIGTIRIGTIPGLSSRFFPHLLSQFKKHYPLVKIIVFEGNDTSIKDWLDKGEIDIGFLSDPGKQFDFIPLLHDSIFLYSSNELFQNQTTINLKEIENYSYIHHKGDSDCFLGDLFQEQRIKPNICYELQDITTILTMVEVGIGITILPTLSVPAKSSGVKMKKIKPEIERVIGVAVHSMDNISPTAAEFVLQAKELMKKIPVWEQN